MNPAIKPKPCKGCKSLFMPARPLARVCSPHCAQTVVNQANAKKAKLLESANRKETKAKLEKLKTRATLAKEAQTAVNLYVRLRDAHLGCASCDRPASWDGQWHASHFRSVGAASGLRFNLWNIHKACSICNNHLSGNLGSYGPRLVAKIGIQRVEWLYSQNAVVRHDAEYFKRMKRIFTKKAKRMEVRNAMPR